MKAVQAGPTGKGGTPRQAGRRPGEAADLPRVVADLLDWYGGSARDLPWRRTRDPYGIWVSEIMLQQTQVQTVIPYWERWMRELPCPCELAKAPEGRVLKLWEGLGYYRRARNLQAAARRIQEAHGGVFPRRFEEVLALPGIGRYTAGAICSIAFNQPTPILDGNVIRVLCRFGAVSDSPLDRRVNDSLWKEATRWVQTAAASGRPDACSHLNQALMELGATVCTPRGPDCGRCPMAGACLARVLGRPEGFPVMPPRVRSTPRCYVVALLRSEGRFWLRRRDEAGVNGGLWEFPNVEVPVEGRGRLTRPLPWDPGWEWAGDEPLVVVRHAITRYRITQRAYPAVWKGPGDRPEAERGLGRWCAPEGVKELPMSRAHRRIADAVMGANAGLHWD